MVFGQSPYSTSDDGTRAAVANICGRCHGLDYYVTPRSRKSWQLTVYRMRDYDYGDTATFTDSEAERAIDYLATHFHEDSALDPAEHFGANWEMDSTQTVATVASSTTDAAPPSTEITPVPAVAEEVAHTPAAESTPELAGVAPATEPDPTLATAVVPRPRPVIAARVREKLENPPWRPGIGLMLCAKCTAYSAVLCLLGLVLTGHNRRRLRKRFRPVHATLALGLFLSLACHGLVYLARYGTPPVLWYWFGAASFLVLVMGQLQGILRKRFGKVFLRIHVYAGYTGLSLAILHWVWAWL